MHVELLYFDGCPSWATADQRLREVALARGLEGINRQMLPAGKSPLVLLAEKVCAYV